MEQTTRRITRDEAVRLIREHRDELERFGVRSLSLFGSVARDEAGEASDVDVLADLGPEPTFDGYMGLKFFLEDLLGTHVDVVTPGGLHPRIERLVNREVLRVA